MTLYRGQMNIVLLLARKVSRRFKTLDLPVNNEVHLDVTNNPAYPSLFLVSSDGLQQLVRRGRQLKRNLLDGYRRCNGEGTGG